MIDNLVVFYSTTGTNSNGVRLWPESSKLWPTYLTLGVAALSTILATATLMAYFWGTKVANRWNIARVTLSVIFIIFSIVMWAIAIFALQSTSSFDGTGSQSLWSATCDSTEEQHELFGHIVNFRQFCLMQVHSLKPPLKVLFWRSHTDGCLCVFRNGDWFVRGLELLWKV